MYAIPVGVGEYGEASDENQRSKQQYPLAHTVPMQLWNAGGFPHPFPELMAPQISSSVILPHESRHRSLVNCPVGDVEYMSQLPVGDLRHREGARDGGL